MAAIDQPVAVGGGIFRRNSDIILAVMVVTILSLMIIPMSSFVLDMLFVVSIAAALMILLIGIYVTKPLEFSVFPTVLLLVTMFRLALNLASSRLILLHGSQGEDAAGQVIKAFGQFVVGGNTVVGLIVFFILNIINFVVITKGAGRISEVSARFTLDAMPGKQMAIDADLNAGIIDEKTAKDRRQEVQSEADFYGSMDGASKFVRGDAIAGILITFINIVGGFIIGMLKEDMTFMHAIEVYTILTIGDGLVTQIPALIISFAAGMIVTKVNKNATLESQLMSQIFRTYRPLAVVSGILLVMTLVPGLPKIPFILLSGSIGFTAYRMYSKIKEDEFKNKIVPAAKSAASGGDDSQQSLAPVLDVLEIEVGYDLVPLVNNKENNELVKRILALRRQFSQDMGILVPPIHIQDNLQLRGNEYQIMLKSVSIAKGELLPGHYLAMESGRLIRTVDGVPTKEPTYGLPALWVPDSKKEEAILAGYTVVDLGTVLATHLSEVIRKSAHQIFNRQDLQMLLDEFKKTYPKVVADLIPELLPFGTVLKVLQNLLKERIPVRDLLSILECLAAEATMTKDPLMLTEHVRQSLGRLIGNMHKSRDGKLRALSIEKSFEEKLQASVQGTPMGPELHVDPVTAKAFIERVGRKLSDKTTPDGMPVVICSQSLRPHLIHLLEKFIPAIAVLSHAEVAGNIEVEFVDSVGEKD